MRYRFVSRDSTKPTYHVDRFEILDNNNNPVIVEKQPMVVDRVVPKRVGKTNKNRRTK